MESRTEPPRTTLPLSATTITESFCAVAGTSVIRALRHVVQTDHALSYLSLTTLFELIDAIMWHDRIVIVGELDPKDRAMLEALNAAAGDSLFTTIDSPDLFARFADTDDVRKELRRIFDAVFGATLVSLGPSSLNTRIAPTRFSDDDKQRLIEDFAATVTKSAGGWVFDVAQCTALLKQLLLSSYTDPDKRYTVYHLFRAFLYAAIARRYNGTLVGDGLRRLIRNVIVAAVTPPPVTLAKRLYDTIDVLYRTVFYSSAAEYPYVPANVLFALSNAQSRASIVSSVMSARNQVAPYRKAINAEHDILSSSWSAPIEVARAKVGLVAAAEDYFSQIVSRLGAGKQNHANPISRFLARILEDFAAVPSLKIGDDFSMQGSLTGATVMKSISTGVAIAREYRLEKEVGVLIDIVDRVSNMAGGTARMKSLLPVEDTDWYLYDQAFYLSYLPK